MSGLDPAAQFDQLGGVYDIFSTSPFRRQLEFPTVFATLGDVAGLDVLDLGCGSGSYTRMLKQRGAARVVGLDATEGMVEHARSVEASSPLGVSYVAGALPADLDGAFDIVLAVYVLPYAEDLDRLTDICRTAARALRPGGRLVTLPSNPALRREPDYYERYGFRTYGATRGTEPEPVTLDLCYAGLDETVSAWVWSRAAIDAALSGAGFADVIWAGPVVTAAGVQEAGGAFWQPYLDCPHALTVSARLSLDRGRH
ncbi:methyltransferase domain-containing protein [Actinoplanes sp. NPDC051470]|uniref:class I SAM-dependent methyltransferase n=1 Tax=unclassified Actinoplanes TaxID=2626549 RepID=UPI003446B6CC